MSWWTKLIILLVFSLLASEVWAAWKYNPFTRKSDYYQDLQVDSGVTIPQDYIASPTAMNLRDMLVAAGIMSAAPAVATAVEGAVFQDRPGVVFQERTNAIFQERATQ